MSNEKPASSTRTRSFIVFGVIAVAWWAFDRIVKMGIDTVSPGTIIARNVLGLFNFQLVHNTGAAWGIFGDSTTALGIFSLIVCAGVLAYVFAYRKGEGWLPETVSLALVFAGGLGNAFDRLTMGYVVDFINCTFIDFPVFNIADIGVTCGIALFFITLIIEGHAASSADTPEGGAESR